MATGSLSGGGRRRIEVCVTVTLRNFKGFETGRNWATFAYRAATRLVWRPNQGDAKDNAHCIHSKNPTTSTTPSLAPFRPPQPCVSSCCFSISSFWHHSTPPLPAPSMPQAVGVALRTCKDLFLSPTIWNSIQFISLDEKIKFIREAKLFDISVTIHQAKLWQTVALCAICASQEVEKKD